MKPSLRVRLIEFIKKESYNIVNHANPAYRTMLYMAFGTLLRYIENASEEELRDFIKDLVSKKEEIYALLEQAKEGKLEVKDAKLKRIYPYLQQMLKKEDNIIKRIVDDFFREFEDEVKDSKDG